MRTRRPTPGQPHHRSGARDGSGGRWLAVVREVAGDRVDRTVATVAVAVGFAFSILLPFNFTQRVSLANWQYFDARYAAFTLAFAVGMAWLVTLQVRAMRVVARNASALAARRRGGPFGAVATIVSLVPSFLCCSPIVPTLVGVLGLSATARLRTTGKITYFFASNQNLLLLGALTLLVVSGLWSMHKLARARCLAEQCWNFLLRRRQSGHVPETESDLSSVDMVNSAGGMFLVRNRFFNTAVLVFSGRARSQALRRPGL